MGESGRPGKCEEVIDEVLGHSGDRIPSDADVDRGGIIGRRDARAPSQLGPMKAAVWGVSVSVPGGELNPWRAVPALIAPAGDIGKTDAGPSVVRLAGGAVELQVVVSV